MVAQCALQPDDEATRRRLAELVVGVDKDPARRSRVEPRPEAVPIHRGQGTSTRRWRDKILARLAGLADPLLGAVSLVVSAFASAGGWWVRDELVASELSEATLRLPTAGTQDTLDPPQPGIDPAVEPLFVPQWTSGILTAALAMEKANGPVDVERLVDQLVRLKVPSSLPRRRRRSITSGAQVLVDLSEDMLPFREDLLDILRRLRRVLGSDRVTVLRFAGRPMTQAGPGRRDTWEPYKPPEARHTVLIVSNFRLSNASFREDSDDYEREMMSLARELDRHKCPVVALVPNAAARVPEQLRRSIRVIEWDRTTTAATAGRAVRR